MYVSDGVSMIVFDLLCSQGHGFEAWFRDSDSYERLVKAGEVQCTLCGDTAIRKALMAPALRTTKAASPPPPAPAPSDATTSSGDDTSKDKVATASLPPETEQPVASREVAAQSSVPYPEKVIEAMQVLRKVQSHIEKNFDHVGRNFAEEARKMHYGETEKRSIYGQATKDEAGTLADEGIEINQIPWLPSHDS